MPKINFIQDGIDVDSKRASSIDGEVQGSDNLFALLMDNITGDSEMTESGDSLLTKTLDGDNESFLAFETRSPQNQADLINTVSRNDEKLLKLSKILGDQSSMLGSERPVFIDEEQSISSKAKLSLDTNLPKTSNLNESKSSPASIFQVQKGLNDSDQLINLNSNKKTQINSGLKAYSSFDKISESNFITPEIENISKQDRITDGELTNIKVPLRGDMQVNKVENNILSKVNSNQIDLSQIDLKGASESDVINEIINHLDKIKLTNAKELNVLVKHNELGQFKINANEFSRNADSKLNLEIISNSKEAQNFFKANESNLVSILNDKGISLNTFKISSSNTEGAAKDNDTSSGDRGFSQQQSRKEQGNQDSRRRANLWQQYQDKLGA